MIAKKKPTNYNALVKELDSIFEFKEDNQLFEFEKRVLQDEIMGFIAIQMKKHNNMSQAELGKKIGKSRSFISQLFSGDKTLNLDTLTRFQRVFNMRFGLVDRREKKSAPLVIVLKSASESAHKIKKDIPHTKTYSSSHYNVSSLLNKNKKGATC